MSRLCSFESCKRQHKAKGYCSTHYSRLLRRGDLEPVHRVIKKETLECCFDGCTRPYDSVGYCKAHHLQLCRTGEVKPIKVPKKGCDFDGCKNPHRAKGYCLPHWRQLNTHGEVYPLGIKREKKLVCTFEGCSNPYNGNGLCSTHSRQKRLGQKLRPVRKFKCIIENCKWPHSSNGMHILKNDEERAEYAKERGKAYRKLNKEKVSEQKKAAYRKNTEHYKKKAKERYEATDPEVRRSYQANYHEKNKDNPEYVKKLRDRANKRRALKKKNGHTPYTEGEVIERWGTKCHICTGEIDFKAPRRPGKKGWELGLNMEHVVPIYLGGEDSLENVKPSHVLCNLKKGSKLDFSRSRSVKRRPHQTKQSKPQKSGKG